MCHLTSGADSPCHVALHVSVVGFPSATVRVDETRGAGSWTSKPEVEASSEESPLWKDEAASSNEIEEEEEEEEEEEDESNPKSEELMEKAVGEQEGGSMTVSEYIIELEHL